jgi:Tfp pilus assembly protein PilE
MTLLELMAAVVILVLVAIPLTSIGTTVYRWYKEDEQKTRAVLVAEQRILELKKDLEPSGWTYGEEAPKTLEQTEPYNLETTVELTKHRMDATDENSAVNELIDVTVKVLGPDLEHPGVAKKTLTTLKTTIRQHPAAAAGGKP